MIDSLHSKKTNTILLLSFVLLFAVFVVFWEKQQQNKDRRALQETAQVIASALWNLDPHSPVAYLELTTQHQNYERITVYAVTNEVFTQIIGRKCNLLEMSLEAIGLIPKITLNATVTHADRKIGRIEAIHRHTTIYIYFYILLIMGLILLAIRLYLRTVEAKNVLEISITERTQDLLIANQGLQQEIHERAKAEGALRDSEERYRQIYNAPSDAIFIHAPTTGAILDANLAASKMYAYSSAEFSKEDIGSLSSGVPPYDMEHAALAVQRAVTHGAQLFEWHCKKKTGELFWVEVALRYTKFNDQEYVIAVVRDIEKRKEIESSLAAEQERLAVTLRSIGDGVITTGINGNIILINKVAEKLTGWNHEEATGKPLTDIFHIINEKTGQRCGNPVDKVLETGQIIGLASHTILMAKDGSKRLIADSGAPIRDKKSEIIGVVLVFRDVTEESRKEKEIVKGLKLESVGLLAGGIAHDFNNILTAILGNINLALLYTKPEEKAYPLLQEAEKASLRAKDLTQQLLTFAKGGDPVKELAAIKEIIEESARFILRGSNVNCHFHCSDDLWPVEIDQGQMSQVIQNIIINANQAMPEGGSIEVHCSNITTEQSQKIALNPREYIKINIQDSGIGIANSLLDKIFEPYFTTKQKGSGLGLAVSHSIITKHDGYIRVTSEPGRGTTFTIYLPSEKDLQLILPSPQGATPEVSGQGRIMIMDDEDMVRNVCQGILKHYGYDVILAEDGDEAITLFKESCDTGAPIDLIIMDLTIPGGMGGEEAVKEILKIAPNSKIIVASGYSNDPIMANYQNYGFCAALVKPFQFQELQTTIQQVLATSPSTSEPHETT